MKYNKEFLISEIIRFNNEHGRPPIGKELDAPNTGFPSRKTFSKYFGSFGNALVEAGFEYRGILNHNRRKPMPKGIYRFTKEQLKECVDEYIQTYGEVPSLKDIIKIPNCPDRQDFRRLFGSYNNAIIEFGYTPKFKNYYTDEDLEVAFLGFVEKHQRIPKLHEFNNSDYPSFWCYQNRFGSWTNAVKHYGFEPFGHKSLEELKNDILRLCQEIEQTENRTTITHSDIDKSDFCSASVTYGHNFRRHLNMSLGDYVRSIGYDMTKSGLGMNYKFEDGEIAKSMYEYETSIFLRERLTTYNRDVKYRDFIPNYNGNKDCDYVVKINSSIWYIEVAGMMEDSKSENKININYENNLNEKIQMLESANLNYKIIYPSDFKEKSLDEILSFLYN